MIKFSEVKLGQIFTFSYYDKRNCPIDKSILWVFVKTSDTAFITIDAFAKDLIGRCYRYDKDDDSPCLLLTATFDDFY
jgi:hypothetical protein